jgi:hypothetical protein
MNQENTYFYQSISAESTLVDFSNPLHLELIDLILNDETPSPRANKLMRDIGFTSTSIGLKIHWSSDLYLVDRTPGTGKWYK